MPLPFKEFSRIVLEWLHHQQHHRFLDQWLMPVVAAPPKPPERSRLWHVFLVVMLPDDYRLLAETYPVIIRQLSKRLTDLSRYTVKEKIIDLLNQSILLYLPPQPKEKLAERILDFHGQIEGWSDGFWHRLTLENSIKSVSSLIRFSGLDTDWQAATFLGRCGYPVPWSQPASLAWQKWSGADPVDHASWCQNLSAAPEIGYEGFELDRILDLVFHPAVNLTHLPGLCQNLDSCTVCPLDDHCQWLSANQTVQRTVQLENNLMTGDTDEIDNSVLIRYLAGPRWTGTDFQQSMMTTFLEHRLGEVTDTPPHPEDQRWLLWLKGIEMLSDRYSDSSFPPPPIYFQNSQDIYNRLKGELTRAHQESFYTLILDNKHRRISLRQISRGTLNQSLVHPREVFAPSIQLRAAAVVLIHNHPSGDPRPSHQDIEITKRLIETGHIVGIKVLDHIIFGKDGYYSFLDEGILF